MLRLDGQYGHHNILSDNLYNGTVKLRNILRGPVGVNEKLCNKKITHIKKWNKHKSLVSHLTLSSS